jgi:sugar phosphate isomerase/epimerase
MRLAISNIAWDAAEDDAIAAILRRLGVDAIDIAPGKYFSDPAAAGDEDISRVQRWWSQRGIEITGMQALLFGATGLNVFGPAESQEAMLRHLDAICRIGSRLGAPRLVFGSPRNRDRTGLSDEDAIQIAVPFFRRLGDRARAWDVIVCLEPNPTRYGANFMVTAAETAKVVELVSHPSIRMQLDTGALTIDGEDVDELLERHAALVGHIHASEPDLVPLGDGATDHARIASAVARHLPGHVVSVEMLATKAEPHEASVERALTKAIGYYS